MTPPIVTAVGRLLTPRNGEPQVRDVIARQSDGTYRHMIRRTIRPATTTETHD